MLFSNISIVNKDYHVSRNAYLLTEGAFIKYIGKEDPRKMLVLSQNGERVPKYNLENEEVIDGKNKLIMPAFFNTHCHVPMTLLRGYGDGLPLDRWLNEKIFPFEAKFEGKEKYAGAKLGAVELLKSGCVSITDMYMNLADYGEGLYEMGMKANLCNAFLNFNPHASFFEDSCFEDTQKLFIWLKDHNDGRIIADIGIHAEYTTFEPAVREACDYARESKMRMQVHISETELEHEACKERHNGMTPVQYFETCGLFDVPVTAAHCVYIEDDDVEIMKKHGAYMAACPSSNLKLASGIAPLRKFYQRGLNITIGTDGASSNNNLNMLEEIQLEALLCRGQSRDANAIPARDILKIATREGALSQGRNDTGILDEGMRADIIMFDMDKPHLTPNYDPISNIVFAAAASDICMTMCDGKVLYRDGEILTGDEEKIRHEAEDAFETVLKRL